VIIIHGDHGSRIVGTRPAVENTTQTVRDYAMTYSTLFAIRAPGIEPGTIEGRAALDELLEDFARSDFHTAPPSGSRPAEIILATMDWRPKKRVSLPNYDDK
jgi:hypothetical protein